MSPTSYPSIASKKCVHVGIVGATGAVGEELLRLLESRAFPLASLRCFGSAHSVGRSIVYQNVEIPVVALAADSFRGLDIVFFVANEKVSQEFVPSAVRAGAIAIDKSAAFRLDPCVPLVVPEINCSALSTHQGVVASPNCTTILVLMVLAPLHKTFGAKRAVAVTYQAISGAGRRALDALKEESRALLEGSSYGPQFFSYPMAFNVFLHNSPHGADGYSGEERKVILESRKILEDPCFPISATCVRVPTIRAHAVALNIEFSRSVVVEEVEGVLRQSSGILYWEDRVEGRFPTPRDAACKKEILYGRVRKDISREHTLDIWVVGDQLLKGAALNGVQIAEHVLGI